MCPPGRRQIEIFDSVMPGLALRVGKGGTKAWAFFTREGGKRKRITLGSAALLSVVQARDAARQVLGGRSLSRAHSGESVEALVALFLQRLNARPRTAYEYQRMIKVEVLPRWKGARSPASAVLTCSPSSIR